MNSNFVSILTETQIEIKIHTSEKRKVKLKFIFQNLRNEKDAIFIFQKINFFELYFLYSDSLSICGLKIRVWQV